MRGHAPLRIADSLETPDGKRRFNEALFTEVAPRYHRAVQMLSLGRDTAWKRALVGCLPDWKPGYCVDLACGTGDVTRLLAERYPRAAVLGLDLTERMLRVAQDQDPFQHITWTRQDMNRLALVSGSVEVVTAAYALRNAPALEPALAEIRRILRPGGILAVLEFARPAPGRMASIQHRLLSGWGRFWGILFHGNPEVYGYIAASLARFPDRAQFRALLGAAGFRVLQTRRYYIGTVEMLILRRQAEPGVKARAAKQPARRAKHAR